MSQADNGWRDFHWASAEGLTLHARDYPAAAGEGRLPVVCLHGLTRNARDFDALAPWIAARGRRVLAADVRGRGLSDRDPAASYWLPTYADDVRRMAEALGIEQAIFIGTSMGGLIMMELAATTPTLIAGAVINDVGPVLAAEGLARIGTYVGNAPAFDSWDAAATYLERQNETALPHYRAEDWGRMARRMFRDADGRVAADYDPAIAAAFGTGPLPADPWERWHGLASGRPLLLLRGGLSDLLAAGDATRMITEHAGARLREVPNVGHAPMLDEPEALAAIGQFLDEVP
ncbi:MAG TPA: alpha/beta hydrolase [Sphingomonas sp.]|uniref:alpha/beta fold hydrolase n=1 Tax=Sphingomonas sp. TaxID=28214 RepID=UPI002C46B5C6|nr:alpha/beta hydrolase [Sphingomonas sp.]HMI20516.1 alpha/beta hydrolase [Sphingomonas sp.]